MNFANETNPNELGVGVSLKKNVSTKQEPNTDQEKASLDLSIHKLRITDSSSVSKVSNTQGEMGTFDYKSLTLNK